MTVQFCNVYSIPYKLFITDEHDYMSPRDMEY